MGTILTTPMPRNKSGYSKIKSRQTPTYDPDHIKYRKVDKYGEPTQAYWHQEYAEKRLASQELESQSRQRSGKNIKYVHRQAGTNFGQYTPGSINFAKPGTDVIEEEKYRKRKAGKSILKSVTTGAPWMGHPKRNLQWRFRHYAPTYKSKKGD